MSAARRGEVAQPRSGPARPGLTRPAAARAARHAGGADQAHAAPRYYVVHRTTTWADGSIIRSYEVPGRAGSLDATEFAAWLAAQVPQGREAELVSMLVIQEAVDHHGAILTCSLERRRGSATGAFQGEPARITFIGAIEQVRLYRAAARGRLAEIPYPAGARPPPSRVDHLAGEEAAIRQVFGPAARLMDVREPTMLEDMAGLSSIVHLRTADGIDIDCGLGWHGTTPFLLRANFPRFGNAPELPASGAAAIALAAVTGGLTTFETRNDERGPAMMARATRDGTLHVIRPGTGNTGANDTTVEPYALGIAAGLLNADQMIWVNYAETHERLTPIDAYRDGRSDNVFVITGAPDGNVTRHLIDADGVEVWRAAANDTAAATVHRENLKRA
jgi:hypothetical protein